MSPVPVNIGATMRTGAPRAKARITPATPTPAPMSALPEMTGCIVSPAPAVPKVSSTRPCFLKMPASWPSVGAWFSQLLICPIATFRVSSARTSDMVSAAVSSASARLAKPALFICVFLPLAWQASRRLCRSVGQAAALYEPRFPVFPGPALRSGKLVDRLRHFDLARRQQREIAEPLGLAQVTGIVAGIDGAENQLAQARADHGCAMASHQHHGMFAERAGERGAFGRFHHQQIGVAEFIATIPERRKRPHGGAEMKHRHDRIAADAEWHHGRRMMMAHRSHVRPRFENLAMDDALGIELCGRRLDGLGVEVEFQNVGWLYQLRRTRPRQEVPTWVVGMANAHMPEGVDHALMGENAVGNGKLVAQVGEFVGHGTFLVVRMRAAPAEYRPCRRPARRTCLRR